MIICSSKQESVTSALQILKDDPSIAFERVHAFQCDCSSKAQRVELLQKVQDQFGRLDVLILNHATITHVGNQMEITEEQYDTCMNVNLKSIFFMIQESLPLLK